jgi:integrase
MAGGIGRRCRCRDKDGKELGANCPKLKQRKHGTWYMQQELFRKPGDPRNLFRRRGYETKNDAQDALDKVRELIKLADGDEENLQAITVMLMALDRREAIPKPEEVRTQLRSKLDLNSKVTIGEWLDTWYAQWQARFRQGKGRKNTLVSYEGHIRNYLKPKIGHIRLDRLTVDDLIEMFNKIADDNDAIVAANDDRRAKAAEIKATRKKAVWRRIRAELEEMPPFRRTVGLSSQGRILATLRASLNDAIAQQRPIFNPATHYSVGAKKPKPIIWTAERVEKWTRTGKRPGPVMVWTPAQAGQFLDYVAVHDPDFEAMWHLLVCRGPRRGETAGLGWTEVHLEKSSIEFVTQLTQIKWVVEEGDPKTDAGTRTIPVDAEGIALLQRHRARQNERRLALGSAWVDSGKVFIYDDGSPLRPSWISDRFVKLYMAAGLPPIRLHDLRHTAATLMLAAGVDMKVVQETLGHSTYATTSDVYTSVLPELAEAAAEAAVAIVPRSVVSTSSVSTPTDDLRSPHENLSGAPPKRRSPRRAPRASTSAAGTPEVIAN